jgi:hypothetical protein
MDAEPARVGLDNLKSELARYRENTL